MIKADMAELGRIGRRKRLKCLFTVLFLHSGWGNVSISSSDPSDLARYLSALIYGMALLAADGATRGESQGVADVAMSHWPNPNRSRRPKPS
jgi:hypothetical protein